MTTLELIEYYSNLLILQYRGLPRAVATIEATVSMVIMNQLPIDVQNAFAIGTAVGPQLDIIGKYVGVSRNGYGTDGPISLVDSDYTQLIKLAVLKNNSGSSLYDLQILINTYFSGLIKLFDNKDMSLSYYLSTDLGSSDLLSMIVYQDFLPSPMGVSKSVIIVEPNVNPYFKFRTYEAAATDGSPLNSYADYQLDRPWFSYQDPFIF